MQISPDFASIERLSFLACFPFHFSIFCLILLSCAQRVPSNRERSTERGRISGSSSEKKSTENTQRQQENGGKRSEKSEKNEKKTNATDSIKIIRGQKNVKKAKVLGPKANGETDSQHTEIIHIPLGKAANNTQPTSKLTSSPQKKESSSGKDGKKVKFAEVLVNEKNQKSGKSKKSAKSKKSQKSKKSIDWFIEFSKSSNFPEK